MMYLNKFIVTFFSAVLLLSPFSYSAPEMPEGMDEMLEGIPVDQAVSIRAKMAEQQRLAMEIEESLQEINTLVPRPEQRLETEADRTRFEKKSRNWIFGYDLFSASPTTFAPATEIPIPSDYYLGPGDVLSIRVHGGTSSSTGSSDVLVNRNGSITVPGLGEPIGLVGLTLDQARKIISGEVASQILGADAVVTLKELRSVRIFMLGAAYTPGSYLVSSLATISNALFVSGGVSDIGSLRNIQLKRKGKTVHTYDLYDLLLKGDTSQDIRLQPGDAIFIPVLKKTVRMQGNVRRSSLFELKENETLSDLIELAGGFKSESLPAGTEINRLNKDLGVREIIKINALKEGDLLLRDGDIVNIPGMTAMDEINVTLSGQFKYPGVYSVKNGEKLSSLLQRTGGFTDSAYLYGAVLTRETVAEMQNASFKRTAEDMETAMAAAMATGQVQGDIKVASELIWRLRNTKSPGRLVVDVDPVNIESDPEKDIYMEDGDRIHIPIRSHSVTVVGDIYSPATVPYKSGHSSTQYIKQTGGFRSSADKGKIFIILPDGQARSLKGGIWRFGKEFIAPGSTIVIPRQTKPFDWLIITETLTPIFANLATSAAALAAIND